METVKVHSVIRRMRGGSQSTLVSDGYGRFFVAKLLGNPQGNRTLINECIASYVMIRVGIRAPALALLQVPDPFLFSRQMNFRMAGKSVLPLQGLHLGSECPVDPNRQAIFDFLPKQLLTKVENLRDFVAAYVVDSWLNQTDTRQVVFTRNRQAKDVRFSAHFIDHGYAFGGSEWNLETTVIRKASIHSSAFDSVDTHSIVKDTINRIEAITFEELWAVTDQIPEEWFAADERLRLRGLLGRVCRKVARLRALLNCVELSCTGTSERSLDRHLLA